MAIIVEPERMIEFASVAKDLVKTIWRKTSKLDGAIVALIDEEGQLQFVDTTNESSLMDTVEQVLKNRIACVISIFETDLVEDELLEQTERESLLKLTRSRNLVTLISGQCFIFAYACKIDRQSKTLGDFRVIDPFSIAPVRKARIL